MIIKLEMHDPSNVEVGSVSPKTWRFIDGLSDILCWPINGAIETEKNPSDDYDETYWAVSPNAGFSSSVGISAKTSDGKCVLFLSNLSVYLLNDSGKTIERLN